MNGRTKPMPVYDGAKVMRDMAERGVDVLRLAELTRLHNTTIRRFLTGEIQTIKTAVAIATALGTTPKRYFAGVREAA